MREFWRERRQKSRAYRPRARPEFVQALAERVREEERPRAARFPRVALAAALTAAMLVALGSFGGLGYAANGGDGLVRAVKAALKGKPQLNRSRFKRSRYAYLMNHTPAHNQYRGQKCLIRHRTGSAQNPFVIIEVAGEAVPAHLAHGDQVISCRPRR